MLLALLVAGVWWVGADAERRREDRSARQDRREAVVRVLGTADLFLSSSSRWIRHPSLSEPGAAFQETPAGLDMDSAGGVIGPAPELMAAGNTNRLEARSEP
jgi:hypothetical protein